MHWYWFQQLIYSGYPIWKINLIQFLDLYWSMNFIMDIINKKTGVGKDKIDFSTATYIFIQVWVWLLLI